MASRLGMQICQAKRRREEKIGGEIEEGDWRLIGKGNFARSMRGRE